MPVYQMGQQAQLAQQAPSRQYGYPAVGRPRHASKASRERTIPELLMHDNSPTQLSSSGMQVPVASMKLYPSPQEDYVGGELQAPLGQTFGDLTDGVPSASVYNPDLQYTSSIAQPTPTQTDMQPLPTTTNYTADLSSSVLQQKLISSEYPSTLDYSSAPVTVSHHQGVPSYDTTASLQLAATTTGCNELDNVIDSLSNIQATAPSCVSSSDHQNPPSHTVLSTSTYPDSAISLSDIEPSVVNELITSMSELPTTLPQPTFNSHAPSMAVTSGNNTYVSQSLNELPLGVTQAGDFALPESSVGYAPASSSYYDCSHTGSSSAALQVTSTYPSTHAHTHQHQQPPPAPPISGLTRRLQHYPLEQAPVPYTHQNGFSPPQPTSAGSNSSKSPMSSYYPSPPNSNELQHTVAVGQADPPSLTPSPESRDHGQFTTESHVESLIPPHDFTIHHTQPYNCITPSLTRMESYV